MTTPETGPETNPETEQWRREKSERYYRLSQRLLKHAQEQLDRGDTVQASEKAYGAVSHAVKSCGELRGWNHYNHHRVGLILEQLHEEWNAPALTTGYLAVKALHDNCFEYELRTIQVQTGIDAAREMIDILATIRTSDPRPLSSILNREQRRRLGQLMQPPAQDQADVDDLPPLEDLPE